MRRWMFVAALLLAPGPAWAAAAQTGRWTRSCSADAASSVTALRGGESACYTPDTGADDESATPILSVGACENVDLFLSDDFDGDATVCTVTWAIEMCPQGASALATDALKNAACAALPGATSLSGDDVESNLAGQYIRLHGENAGANIDSCQIVAKCALEGSK